MGYSYKESTKTETTRSSGKSETRSSGKSETRSSSKSDTRDTSKSNTYSDEDYSGLSLSELEDERESLEHIIRTRHL